jgi:predicted transcriptional regulator
MTEEEDDATIAAIDRGIQDADQGLVVSSEKALTRWGAAVRFGE